jgi:sortase A
MLYGSVLIWTGVIVFGLGLLVALYNQHNGHLDYTSLFPGMPAAVATTLPAQPEPVFPAGWSTATPMAASGDASVEALPGKGFTTEAIKTAVAARGQDHMPGWASKDGPATPLPPAEPPDRLVIPRIALDSSIVPIGWETVDYGEQSTRVWQVVDDIVGWHKTSAYPGRPGNVVLNGHHNVKGEVFRYLVDLEKGDRIQLYAKDQSYTYAVEEKQILKEKGEPLAVRRENAQWIAQTEDERLTLITCWPYTNNTHRLIVVAKPITDRTAVELGGAP